METTRHAFDWTYSFVDKVFFVAYCFMVGTLIIKALFAAVQLGLFVTSIALLSSNTNTKAKNELYVGMAAVALVALVVMALAGFNNIILMIGEMVIIRYWLKTKYHIIAPIVTAEVRGHIVPVIVKMKAYVLVLIYGQNQH